MGFVLNMQRRALEVFAQSGFAQKPWPPEALTRKNIDFFLGKDDRWSYGGAALSFLGVSRGIGTCSDLHGVDIAVFGLAVPRLSLRWDGRHQQELDLSRLAGCAYAVFLWPDNVVLAEPLERFPSPYGSGRFIRVNVKEADPMQSLQTTELLEFSSFRHKSFGHWKDGRLQETEEYTTIYLTRTGLLSSYNP